MHDMSVSEAATPPADSQDQSDRAVSTNSVKLKWSAGPKAPVKLQRGSAVVSGDGCTAYFTYKGYVYQYSRREKQWSKLPPCPTNHAGLVVVEGLLTIVGGQTLAFHPTNDVFSLTQRKGEQPWTKFYPPMPSPRWTPAVVCSDNSLVVAGGYSGNGIAFAVEVMDTSSRQWFTASSLPQYSNDMSATLCHGKLYLLGGYDNRDSNHGSLSVLICSLTDLLETIRRPPLSTGAKPVFREDTRNMWKKAADIPVYFATCATVCGRVIAVGGNLKPSFSDRDPTDCVYQYSPIENTWTVIGHLSVPRYVSLTVALAHDEILVAGGNTSDSYGTDQVEIGALMSLTNACNRSPS